MQVTGPGTTPGTGLGTTLGAGLGTTSWIRSKGTILLSKDKRRNTPSYATKWI